MHRSRPIAGGVIAVYFVIALEVLVMISPFAGFFYAVFNPVLLFLAGAPSTRWLADFFLPHMVVPPDALLAVIRVAGSVLFVGGAVAFLVCAGQVYFHKLARRGPALGGLYRVVRHPQYVSLAVTGLGLAILWPRFLTLALWDVMVALYVWLARDEERRMQAAFGDAYRAYMARTGMLAPRGLEALVARLPGPRSFAARSLVGLALTAAITLGGAFALRAHTVARLPLWTDGRVSVLPVLPADGPMLQHRMAAVLQLPAIQAHLPATGAVLAYAVPTHYVMQGMIADTGAAYRLYEHHQTLSMIADWIFHPFRHLEGGGHAMMHAAPGPAAGPEHAFAVRRIIFLGVPGARADRAGPAALFAIGGERVPSFFADVDLHALTVLDVQPLGPGTGWGKVPTPMF